MEDYYNEYPELQNLDDGTTMNTSGALIHNAVNKTLFAVSSDDLRPAMMGVYFQMGTEESRFVATDGHRLVKYTNREITASQDSNFIVPDKALSLIQKTISGENCELTVTEDHARFKSGNTIVITRLINEQYPSYDSVIPKDNDKFLTISKEQMLSTVRRV